MQAGRLTAILFLIAAVWARQGKAIDTATFGYDFRETSSSTHRAVVKKVSRHDFVRPGVSMDYTGAH